MIPTIGDKIVEALHSNRVTSENKRIRAPPLPPPFQLGCLLVPIGSSNMGTTLREGIGEEKLYFLLLKIVKRKKPSFGRSASTHFVADCRQSSDEYFVQIVNSVGAVVKRPAIAWDTDRIVYTWSKIYWVYVFLWCVPDPIMSHLPRKAAPLSQLSRVTFTLFHFC